MATSQKLDSKSLTEAISEFAPAMDTEAVMDRPIAELFPFTDSRFQPGVHTPTGAWADGRSSFGLEAEGGPGFLDPGTFALGSHRTDMMSSIGISGGAVDSASADLSMSVASDFGGGGGGGGGSGGGDGGGSGGGGGGAVSSGGNMA